MRSRAASARKITMVTTAGAAAALLAAGCSSGSGITSGNAAGTSMSPARAVTLAAQQAQRVNSFAGTLSVKLSGRVSGTVAGRMQMRQRPSLLADLDLSTVDVGSHNLAGGVHEIIDSKSIYMQLPPLARELGKPWLRLTFSELKGASGVDLGQLTQQAENDSPMLQTQMLAAAQHVRMAGMQTIGGVKTTEYTGSYPLSAALAKLPASVRGQMRSQLRSMGLTSARFTVWLDAQHHARKLVVAEHGTSQQTTMTMQVTSINQPVKVSLPPASQVRTVPASALGG